MICRMHLWTKRPPSILLLSYKNFPLVNEHPDVAGLLRDPYILRNLGAAMASSFHDEGITKVIAPEARAPCWELSWRHV